MLFAFDQDLQLTAENTQTTTVLQLLKGSGTILLYLLVNCVRFSTYNTDTNVIFRMA